MGALIVHHYGTRHDMALYNALILRTNP
jgi:hypothetical protein